jgi:hypothetical protein
MLFVTGVATIKQFQEVDRNIVTTYCYHQASVYVAATATVSFVFQSSHGIAVVTSRTNRSCFPQRPASTKQ